MKKHKLKRSIALMLAGVLTVTSVNLVPLESQAAWEWSPTVSKSGYAKITEGIFVKADSEQRTDEDEQYHGFDDNAVDGITRSYWHTNWGTEEEDNPKVTFDDETGSLTGNNTITLTLSDPQTVQGVTYLPRQDSFGNGAITKCYVEVRTEGSEDFVKVENSDAAWSYEKTDAWDASNESREERELIFDDAVENAEQVRLVVLNTAGDPANHFINAAEISLLTPTEDRELNQKKEILSVTLSGVEAKLEEQGALYANLEELQAAVTAAQEAYESQEASEETIQEAIDRLNNLEYLFEDEIGSGVYLSDLDWVSADNMGSGWGSIAKDKHQGGSRPLTLRLDGADDIRTYQKGIGTHAKMKVTYDIAGKGYKKFTAIVGVDSEQEAYANLRFYVKKVEGDEETILYDSRESESDPGMNVTTPAKQVDVDVTDVDTLVIETNYVTDDGNGHGNWCDAKLYKELKGEEPISPLYRELALDGTNPKDVSQDADFYNAMDNFKISMVYRFANPENKKYALLSLGNGEGEYITIWHNPKNASGTGQLSVVYNGCTGLYWSRGLYYVNDTDWHKLTLSLTGNSMYITLDGQTDSTTYSGDNWFGYSKQFLAEHNWTVSEVLIGGMATGGSYSYTDMANFSGDIKYLQVSSEAADKDAVAAENTLVDEELKGQVHAYVAECDNLTEEDYTPGSWAIFASALEAARSAATDWALYNTYDALKAARGALEVRGDNQPPVALENVSRTLAKERTLVVYADELASDEDGDPLTITEVQGGSKVTASVEDGKVSLSCGEAFVEETLTVTVSDGIETVEVPLQIDGVTEDFRLLYDEALEDVKFDGSNAYTIPVQDARYLSQLEDSLELSFTFRYETSVKNFIYLMEMAYSKENGSESNDNAGGLYHPAKSTMLVMLQPSEGKVFLHTGAYAGSTAWQATGNQVFNDGKYHTLTMSVAPDGLRFQVDGNSLVSVDSADTSKQTKAFVQSFFGENQGEDFKDWRSRIDTITIGGVTPTSALRHSNYGNFKGEIKSVMISDGGYSEESFAEHHTSGAPKALEKLKALMDSVVEDEYDEEAWKEFMEGDAYTNAAAMSLENAAYEIYGAYEALAAAVDVLSGNIDFDAIGGDISNMFNGDGDNTWLFAGGVEAQGRFAEVAGVRNYVGQFEEYVRWVKASVSSEILKRQRYTINVGKAGQDIQGFEAKLDGYIESLAPKAVAYLIGREDYEKGQEGIEVFKEALASVIEKSLAMKNNGGYAVIQLPHAGWDEAASEKIALYAEAAKSVISELKASDLNRVVLVDHLKKTDTDSFKNGNYMTSEGLLNANGHYEIAKQFAQRTFGSTDGFPSVTNWEITPGPENYVDVAPEVSGLENALKVTVPEAAQSDGWVYELMLDEMTIRGTAEGKEFEISELPSGASYELCLLSSDGKQKLRTVTGVVAEDEKGAAPILSDLQKEIRGKVDAEEPLTWLFMGDSITHAALWTNGYDGIAQHVEKYLKEDLERSDDVVVNTAVSGADTKTTMDNLKQRLSKYTPDIVSIMLGTNDVATSGMTPEIYKGNLEQMVAKIRERNADASIIFRTPTPTNTTRADSLPEYISMMKQVADEDGRILFIDQYTEWDQEVRTFPYLWGSGYYFGDTNLHPGAQGQLRMARQFLEECGLDLHAPIANLSYQFSYTEDNSSIKPQVSVGSTMLFVSRDKLQEEYGQGTIGSIEVTLTDQDTGKTYTKKTGLDGEEFVLENLPTNRTYTVSVTGMMAAAAKRITFAEQEVTLEEGQQMAFQVLLDNLRIRGTQAGTEVGALSVDVTAPEGTYAYSLCEGEGSTDNDKFVIEGNKLKVKTPLEAGREYSVRIRAASESYAAENVFTLATMPTLETVRREAAKSFEEDQMALDLDLSEIAFDGTTYVDLGDSTSAYYEDGAYLKVLNNLREHTTGGTIVYRFRTTQSSAMIFGAGSSSQADNKNLIFGTHNGIFRGVFRTETSGLFADFNQATGLDDGAWHTVAMSFDTTKEDYQNQILISVDGSNNVFTTTSWWRDGWQSWFNITGEEITNFAIGGGIYSQIGYGSSSIVMAPLNGKVSFVTVTDDVYTEEELKLLSETNVPSITGELKLSIDGDKVSVPEGALYNASDLTWDEQRMNASFVLTPEGEAVFDRESVTVSVENAEELGFLRVNASVRASAITVNLSKEESLVFKKGELTFQSGDAVYGDGLVDSYVSQLKNMAQGSVTVRYKLTDESISTPMAFFSVSNGTYTNGYTSFYITPSTGVVGYEVRTQDSSQSNNVNTGSISLSEVTNTNWHTVTYVFDDAGTKMYFDGRKVLSNSNVGFLSSSEGVAYARIGSTYRTSSNAKAYPFTGEINDIEVTEDVLTEAEAMELHKATAAEELELPETAVKTEDVKLFYAGYDNSVYYRIPTLFTTSKGTTIAGIDKRQSGSADLGNIDTSIRRSTDGGQTWGSPQILFNQPAGQTEHSLTIDPLILEDANGRLHLFVDLFPESRAAMNTGILETGSGFKTVDGKQYPILRNYADTADNAANTWTKEYTIRDDGVVWEEKEDGTAEKTNYVVPDYLSAEGCGDLFEVVDGKQEARGNIYLYTGSNAGELKVPRVMNLVTCYSDDDGVTWKGYRNITGMVKEDWMLFLGLGPGVGICLENQEIESLNGRLIVPVYTANSVGSWTSSQSSTVIYSDDNGETWHLAQSPLEQVRGLDVSTGNFSGEILTESQIVEMNDGTLKLFCRNASGKVKICTGTAISQEEGGVSWSAIETTDAPEVYCQLSAIHYPELVDGREAVILSNPAGPNRNNGYVRVGLYQEDGSFDWKYGQLIHEGEYAYSCLTILKNGDIGVLYEGSSADTFFTSMNLEWLTAPRYAEFEQPVIQDVQMEREGDLLTFTVKLDSYMMKKAEPVLKLKVNGVEREAAYVSGNASKEYTFAYDLKGAQATRIEAVNVGVAASDSASFIEGVTGLMPEDVSFILLDEGDEDPEVYRAREALNELLEEYRSIYESGKAVYTEETWNEFENAYDSAREGLSGINVEELRELANTLTRAYEGLETKASQELEQAREALRKLLKEYQSIYESAKAVYTEESWKEFADAYDAAQEGLTGTDVGAMETLTKALKAGYDGLKKKENQELSNLIEELARLRMEYMPTYLTQKGQYVEVTWNTFVDAYEAVDNALKRSETNLDILKALKKYLTEAYQGLVLKENPVEKPIKLAAPEIQSVKSVAKKKIAGVKITVKKVEGADSYTVYRKYGSKVKTIGKVNKKGVVYDNAPLSKKKVKYYAVAESSNQKYLKSDAGASKSFKAAAAVKRVGVRQVGNKNQVLITWKKTAGAKGYVIYRSTKKNSGFTRVKVVKNGKTVSFVDKKVKKGKTYYYRVIAKGAKAYSGAKASKAIKVKK